MESSDGYRRPTTQLRGATKGKLGLGNINFSASKKKSAQTKNRPGMGSRANPHGCRAAALPSMAVFKTVPAYYAQLSIKRRKSASTRQKAYLSGQVITNTFGQAQIRSSEGLGSRKSEVSSLVFGTSLRNNCGGARGDGLCMFSVSF